VQFKRNQRSDPGDCLELQCSPNGGIAHHLDDWGPKGGHEWPYWHHPMWEYAGAHF